MYRAVLKSKYIDTD